MELFLLLLVAVWKLDLRRSAKLAMIMRKWSTLIPVRRSRKCRISAKPRLSQNIFRAFY